MASESIRLQMDWEAICPLLSQIASVDLGYAVSFTPSGKEDNRLVVTTTPPISQTQKLGLKSWLKKNLGAEFAETYWEHILFDTAIGP